jgi:mRNA interferase RelE/StbE
VKTHKAELVRYQRTIPGHNSLSENIFSVLIVPPDVLKQLAPIPRADRERLLKALEMVAEAPTKRFPFVTEMVGNPGVWRLRKGDWRAVSRICGTDVILDRVGHRKEVYR